MGSFKWWPLSRSEAIEDHQCTLDAFVGSRRAGALISQNSAHDQILRDQVLFWCSINIGSIVLAVMRWIHQSCARNESLGGHNSLCCSGGQPSSWFCTRGVAEGPSPVWHPWGGDNATITSFYPSSSLIIGFERYADNFVHPFQLCSVARNLSSLSFGRICCIHRWHCHPHSDRTSKLLWLCMPLSFQSSESFPLQDDEVCTQFRK